MPTPFFADLVRELCHDGGTGPLTPAGAVPGHRRLADAVAADAQFHYAVTGISRPEQWEVGWGRVDGAGRLLRDTVLASSDSGARVDFVPGLKTIALTVAADWFAGVGTALAAQDGAVAAVADALDARQPLSTLHDAVATGAVGDEVTVRRGADWVNIPLSSIAFRNAEGRLGIGTSEPSAAVHISADTPILRINQTAAVGSFYGVELFAGGFVDGSFKSSLTSGEVRIDAGRSAGWGGYLTFHTDTVERLRLANDGTLSPGADNGQPLGAAGRRWTTIFAATGTINTSDAREKTWRGVPNAAERRAAKRIAAELGFFQWNEVIAVKGAAMARDHFGARAQAVWAIMADEGLIAPIDTGAHPDSKYAFLCCDRLGLADGVAADRFGIREGQLCLFLIAAQEARISALEAGA